MEEEPQAGEGRKKKMEKLITNFVHSSCRHKQLVLFPLRASASAPTPNPNRFSSFFLSLPPIRLRIVMPDSSHRQIVDTVQLAAVGVPPTHLYSKTIDDSLKCLFRKMNACFKC